MSSLLAAADVSLVRDVNTGEIQLAEPDADGYLRDSAGRSYGDGPWTVVLTVGDDVSGMRVIEPQWSKSVGGEVTEVFAPDSHPLTDEALVIVDDASDGEVPVRLSGLEGVS